MRTGRDLKPGLAGYSHAIVCHAVRSENRSCFHSVNPESFKSVTKAQEAASLKGKVGKDQR